MSEGKQNKKDRENMSFEEAMAGLEAVTAELAKEGLPLEEAMALYGQGVELVRVCNQKLEAAERTIKLLGCNEDGEITETDFLPKE